MLVKKLDGPSLIQNKHLPARDHGRRCDARVAVVTLHVTMSLFLRAIKKTQVATASRVVFRSPIVFNSCITY